MRKNLLVSLALSLSFAVSAYAQEKAGARVCADVPGQTSGTHRFRVGETLEIPLRGEGVAASVTNCEPVELKVNWANGRNNGAMFNVTFLDDRNSPIYTRQIPGFLPGVVQFPLQQFDSRGYGSSMAMVSVPTMVTIQAVEPFMAPAVLSYRVTSVSRETGAGGRERRQEEDTSKGNEVVSIRNVVRLVGSGRIPLVQIELKTARAFPIKDAPLQLEIGKKIFVDELSGEFTGKKLTLSLTPEMFAELQDGDEIVASFGGNTGNDPAEVWRFGKLKKLEGE
jgi:hypothetical protein